jgi:RNA polymerase sigma factor (sigma-70 family)
MEPDLAALLRSAQAGDRAALNQLLERLRPYLESLARNFADPNRPGESISDLVQETGLLAWQNLSGFRGGESDEQTERQLLAWLAQILRRVGIDTRRAARAQRRSPETPLVSIDGGTPDSSTGGIQVRGSDPTPSAVASAQETEIKVASALARLDDPVSQTLAHKVFVERRSLRDCAAELNLTYDQVRHRYHKILSQLEQELGDLES